MLYGKGKKILKINILKIPTKIQTLQYFADL